MFVNLRIYKHIREMIQTDVQYNPLNCKFDVASSTSMFIGLINQVYAQERMI